MDVGVIEHHDSQTADFVVPLSLWATQFGVSHEVPVTDGVSHYSDNATRAGVTWRHLL